MKRGLKMKIKSFQFPRKLVPRNLVLGAVFLGSLTTHLAATKIGEALTTMCRPRLEKVSLITCQLRDLFQDGVQNHLTEPTENSQDSNQLMGYPGLRSERKAIGRVFGLRLIVGNPLVREGYLPTEP